MKSLFKEFKKASKKQWLSKVEKDLKGKSLESLDWKINEDWIVSPFAHSDDLKNPPTPIFNKKNSNAWEKGVRILVKNYKSANREALFLLEKGADAVVFEINDNVSKTELETLLDKIELGWISTHFILNNKSWKSIVINFQKIIFLP